MFVMSQRLGIKKALPMKAELIIKCETLNSVDCFF